MIRLRRRKRLAALRVHDEVEIALAVAQLDIGKAVEFLRQRQQRLGKDRHLAAVDRELAARRAAHDALDADEIAEIQQLYQRQLLGRKIVLVAEDLDLAGDIVEIDEHAAVADGADATRHGDAILGDRARRQRSIARLQFLGFGTALEAIGIGVDAQRLERLELLDPRGAELIVGFCFPVFGHSVLPWAAFVTG